MTDKIKSNVTTSYMMFINSFGDPYTLNKRAIEKMIGCKIEEAFLNQRINDDAKANARKSGKHEFDKVICLYLASFLNGDGIDYNKMNQDIGANPKFLLRSLGKGNMNYLQLMVRILESLEEPKKGLLFGDAS